MLFIKQIPYTINSHEPPLSGYSFPIFSYIQFRVLYHSSVNNSQTLNNLLKVCSIFFFNIHVWNYDYCANRHSYNFIEILFVFYVMNLYDLMVTMTFKFFCLTELMDIIYHGLLLMVFEFSI